MMMVCCIVALTVLTLLRTHSQPGSPRHHLVVEIWLVLKFSALDGVCLLLGRSVSEALLLPLERSGTSSDCLFPDHAWSHRLVSWAEYRHQITQSFDRAWRVCWSWQLSLSSRQLFICFP